MADGKRVTGDQIRAARALLNLSANDLAKQAGLSRGTIQRAELESAEVTGSNMMRIIETLEKLDVIFIPENGEGIGVRKAKRRSKRRPPG
jgi:predicted transcriptional regulator